MADRKIKIEVVDGAKTLEMSMLNPSEMEGLAILHGVFKMFEVDLELVKLIEDYKNIGRIYVETYEKAETIEPLLKQENKIANDVVVEIEQEFAAAPKGNPKPAAITIDSLRDAFKKVGIQDDTEPDRYANDEMNTPLYRASYQCVNGHHGWRLVNLQQKYTKCRECNTKLQLIDADPNHFRDALGYARKTDGLYFEEELND